MQIKLSSLLQTPRPAPRLFLKIFLWFWLTVLSVFFSIHSFMHLTGLHVVKQPNMYATVLPILAAQTVTAYENGGPDAFARFARTNVDDKERVLYLLDGFNQDVLHRPIDSSGQRVARAVKSGELLMLRDHIAGYRFTARSGRPYVLLLYISSPLNEIRQNIADRGSLFLTSFLLIVTLLCLWLAYHITSPIYAIQLAARRVTGGDLTARAPLKILKRHDELASLAMDFNFMVEKIEALLRSHKNLLASVSHEIRSPLARLALSIALLRKENPSTGQDLLLRMEKDIGVLDTLMGQLLILSRFEAGISGSRHDPVDLCQLVEEVGANGNFEAVADDKRVEVRIKDLAVLPAGDHHALRSACENVVRNAIRFTQPGTMVEIELAVERGPIIDFATISVHDRGPGVPEEMLESIFKPFVRVEDEATNAVSSGLGLAIAAGAIHLHHGSIVASNRSGGGLKVVMRLPLEVVEKEDLVIVL
jgi:two-component system, OmpR family, sensor histidine kinase CpxA